MDYLVYINIFLAIIIIFFQRRDPKTVWAWLLLLYFIPVPGFILYLLVGTDMRKHRMFKTKAVNDRINGMIRSQEYAVKNKKMVMGMSGITDFSDLIIYNLETMGALLSDDNDLQIIIDGNDKFDSLIEDINRAKRFIHIQYYIIKNDVVFGRIMKALERKVTEGVEVRILFDAMGCRFVSAKMWKELQRKGIKTGEFFPALLGKLHFRINYRNHRKIVVIDNEIGYVGGFNIAAEYVGLDEKFGYWRDTHLRINGTAVAGLAIRFLLDWNYAAKENLFEDVKYMSGFRKGVRDRCKIQIISSGPDEAEQTIRDNYVHLIHKAKKNICIQSPYFIPDEAVMSALLTAVCSGIEVNIMIPCKPDHPFVYWATYSYIGELVMAGGNCYIYENGFLHAKGIIVDEEVFCYGTANMDIRSFALNFEVNAVIYDEKKAAKMTQIFTNDLRYCKRITKDDYASRPLRIRINEQISRLLSPLL